MGTKGGTILYHIGYGGYGTTLSWPVISGVTNCCQPRCMCWLTNVGWVTKLGYDQICGIGTPTCIVGVFVMVGGRKDLNYSFNNCFTSLNRGSFNSSHNKYTRLNTLNDMLCLLDNDRYYDYVHQFYMLFRTRLCEGFRSKLRNCSN
jgi:hypothetical protein